MDINPNWINQGDGSKQCLPKSVGEYLWVEKGKAPPPHLINKWIPEPDGLPFLFGLRLGHGATSTSFWQTDKSLLHILNLRLIVNHRSLDGSHSIYSISGPTTLEFYVVLVNLHVGTPGSEETPPWMLNAVLIPDTASGVNESSCSLNYFQFLKDDTLVVWCLCPWPIWSPKIPTIFKTFLCQLSNKPLCPSKELNPWESNFSNWDHITIEDSMPSLKPSYNFCVVPALGFKSILKLPISIDRYPIVQNSPLHWVHQLLKENTMTMLWALGSALCDFGNKRVFVMYGPGGLGKSAVVKIFSTVLGNQTYEMPAHYASYKPKSLNNNTLTSRVLLYAACSQMVTVPDFEVHNWPRDCGVIFCSLAVGKVISESCQVSSDDFKTSHSTERRHKQEHACTDRDQWDLKIERLPFFLKQFQEGQKNFDGISPILGYNVSHSCTYPCLKVLMPLSFIRTESGNKSTFYRPCW